MKVTFEMIYIHEDDSIIPSEEYIARYIMDAMPMVIWSSDGKALYQRESTTVRKIEEIGE